MKPVFKCDYCSKIGTEEEIREHEPDTIDYFSMSIFYACRYDNFFYHNYLCTQECKIGKEIPEGKLFEFCSSYERKEKK